MHDFKTGPWHTETLTPPTLFCKEVICRGGELLENKHRNGGTYKLKLNPKQPEEITDVQETDSRALCGHM